jgi:hypothetical protein
MILTNIYLILSNFYSDIFNITLKLFKKYKKNSQLSKNFMMKNIVEGNMS